MTRQGKIQGDLLQEIAEAVCNFPAKEVASLFNIKEGTISNYSGYAKAIYKDNPKAEEIYCRLNKNLRAAIKTQITYIKNTGSKVDFLETIPKRIYKTGFTRKYAPRKIDNRTSLPIHNAPKEKNTESKVTKADLKDVLKVVASGFETLTKLIEKM